MKRFRPRLTASGVIACLALFVALGGASYAALIKLPKNSVGAKQIRKNAITSTKIKDHSLRVTDFKAGQIPQGKQGPQGIPGPTASAFSQKAKTTALESTLILDELTITTTTQSRIIAQASVDLNASLEGNAYCFITEAKTKSELEQAKFDWSIRTNDTFTGDQNTGVIGAKVLPAGTYTVRLACGKNTGTISYIESDFALIAAAT